MGIRLIRKYALPLAVILISALVLNHFVLPEYFPLSPDYEFPAAGIVVSIVMGLCVLTISEAWYGRFQERYFSKAFGLGEVVNFMLANGLSFTGLYLVVYFISNALTEGDFSLYHLLVGFFVSILLISVFLALYYGKRIYQSYHVQRRGGTLKVRSGAQTLFVNFEEIAYFHSVEKTVYLIHRNGSRTVTDFTLNQLEETLDKHSFFRANRQTIVHYQSVSRLAPEVNGKRSLQLQPAFMENNEFTISRYKAREFETWLLGRQA